MSRFVLDGSITMSWCFDDEDDALALDVLARLEREEAIVPAIWPLEVANVLLVGERRRRLTARKSESFLASLSRLPIEVQTDEPGRTFEAVLPLARRYSLSSYDAAYLELAVRAGVPLASNDRGLRKAAKAAGVALVDA